MLRWKICWRLKVEHRDGTPGARRWTVFLYRERQPTAAELEALRRKHRRHEFRVWPIGARTC